MLGTRLLSRFRQDCPSSQAVWCLRGSSSTARPVPDSVPCSWSSVCLEYTYGTEWTKDVGKIKKQLPLNSNPWHIIIWHEDYMIKWMLLKITGNNIRKMQTRTLHYYVGCSGWSYSSWQGPFYPSSIENSAWLNYYSHVFDYVEVDSSFYRIPNVFLYGQ